MSFNLQFLENLIKSLDREEEMEMEKFILEKLEAVKVNCGYVKKRIEKAGGYLDEVAVITLKALKVLTNLYEGLLYGGEKLNDVHKNLREYCDLMCELLEIMRRHLELGKLGLKEQQYIECCNVAKEEADGVTSIVNVYYETAVKKDKIRRKERKEAEAREAKEEEERRRRQREAEEKRRLEEERRRREDEELVKLMEDTKVTKDKRKKQEKDKAREANREHQRKQKEREEFYKRTGMVGTKSAKKQQKK